MALKVKAKEQYQNVGKYAGKYRYVMMPELYTALAQDKVIKEAALRSGVSRGVMQACWDAAGEVIKAWATEGHSVALPGLGTMRFGLRAKSVEKVEEVKAGLISSRRIIFTPDVDLKEELAKTAVQITCFDRTGKEVKRVTSTDDGTVEEGDGENQSTENGGNSGSSGNSGSQSGSGNSGEGEPGDYSLTIYKHGNGTMSVTDDSEQEINSNDNVHSGSNVNISVVPVEGKEPTVKVNGSRITLTENDGTYTGSFVMPTKSTVLDINSDPDDLDFGDDI
jgi:predicted histone-like DNA-binding protein